MARYKDTKPVEFWALLITGVCLLLGLLIFGIMKIGQQEASLPINKIVSPRSIRVNPKLEATRKDTSRGLLRFENSKGQLASGQRWELQDIRPSRSTVTSQGFEGKSYTYKLPDRSAGASLRIYQKDLSISAGQQLAREVLADNLYLRRSRQGIRFESDKLVAVDTNLDSKGLLVAGLYLKSECKRLKTPGGKQDLELRVACDDL
jgi:hypothetical protein